MALQKITKEAIVRQLEQLPSNRWVEVAQFIEFLQSQMQQPVRRNKQDVLEYEAEAARDENHFATRTIA